MNILQVFQSRSKIFYVFLLILGLISSLTSMGILMLINQTLTGKAVILVGAPENNYIAFIVLITLSFLSTSYFQNYMVELTNSIMFNLELSVVQKVRNASFESFERLGSEKIYAAIADTRVLSRVPEIFVTLINASITIICSFIYFFWVSPLGCIVVLTLMTLLLLFYIYRNKKMVKDLNTARDLQDAYYFSLRELLSGFRQIRISSVRNNNLFNKYINANRTKVQELSIRTSKKYIANELTGSYSWYIVLGMVIFVLPAIFHITAGQLAAFITTVLFMMSPVSRLVMIIPFYSSLRIAVERIEKIDKQLAVDALPDAAKVNTKDDFSSVRFQDVRYGYNQHEKEAFHLELSEFNISKGEIIFIIGGNGSGKTTFVNLLTGLCRASQGKIFINEREVEWEEFSAFSNHMAVVYTNQRLFHANYDDHDLSDKNERMHYWKDLINLNGVLKINNAKDCIEVNVSRGQQKRIALLMALMEDKPLLVLDEWAAEQDPTNKKLFYTKWLQEIRSMGKTLIVVSHDDDFYHVADRIVKFDFGRITSDTANVVDLEKNM
ncbi:MULTISPECIES: ATP-binding cassette domain-containing protein [Niastella]|uniref:ATP-binding cassette domain-containing protein n=1 Tax=Niastella soli TaxID=2821487 RepID=A0ABS3Z5W9_9BACT|nr:ATP-binding cassette domain-containing protein [Niastella soli]MBO9205534.1 ATP-binding cassette domain-containing protein [Niastella soli]